MEFRTALKQGLYDFENARNWYRTICAPENGGPVMHRDLVFDWVRANALLMAPFTPHFSEHVWQTILGEKSSVQSAAFPTPSGPIDAAVLGQLEYMRGVVDSIRSAEALVSRRKGGKQKAPAPSYDPSKPKQARIYVARDFPEWQNKSVQLVREAWDDASSTIDEAKLRSSLDAAGLNKDKRAMPFCQLFKVRSSEGPMFAADSSSSGKYSRRDLRPSIGPFLSPSSIRFLYCGR
jgi:leucyl-tRNA synthetase